MKTGVLLGKGWVGELKTRDATWISGIGTVQRDLIGMTAEGFENLMTNDAAHVYIERERISRFSAYAKDRGKTKTRELIIK